MEVSVIELWEMVLSEPRPSPSGGQSRAVMITEARAEPLRLVPQSVSSTAGGLLRRWPEQLLRVVDYVQNAFFYYRECVNREPLIGAPHVLVNGAYEWPVPVDFEWEDWERAILYGRLLNPEHTRDDAIITRLAGDIVHMMAPLKGEIRSKQSTRLDRPERELRFRIPSLASVGFVDPTEWQLTALRGYSNEVRALYQRLSEGSHDVGRAATEVTAIIKRISGTVQFSVARPLSAVRVGENQ